MLSSWVNPLRRLTARWFCCFSAIVLALIGKHCASDSTSRSRCPHNVLISNVLPQRGLGEDRLLCLKNHGAKSHRETFCILVLVARIAAEPARDEPHILQATSNFVLWAALIV